ncbi:MAG: hypothetical protein O7E53_01845 [Alphaproteobacteria bacterium]|nr:hypothetical protein [Alphaproteobacteria bacterium]
MSQKEHFTMHKIDIPDWVKDHVTERRGAVHAFAGMVPEGYLRANAGAKEVSA